MKTTLIRSTKALVLAGNAPAWTTGQDSGYLFPLVQNGNMSISNDRQNSKKIGGQDYAISNITKAPEVQLTIDYYLNPYLSNEYLLGFNINKFNSYSEAFENLTSRNQNFYFLLETDQNKEAFDEASKTGNLNFSGFNALTFGNCYLNSYNVNFAIGQIPTVSVGLIAENSRFESLTQNKLSIPAINTISGNNNGSGSIDLSQLYKSITGRFTGDVESRSEFNPRVAVPYASSFSLQSLQVGGIDLANSAKPILQSFDLSILMDRSTLYGFGSNYPYNRKLQYPINGQVQISCLVSGLRSGSLTSLFNNETGYNFEIAFSDFLESQYSATGFYKIEGAKLDNISYSLPLNGIMAFNASFSFQASDEGGFLMKNIRSGYEATVWESIFDLWQNITFTWESLD